MTDQSQKLDQKTSKDIPNATSSQESRDGALPCNSQDGQQTDLFGQEAALVSPSQPQVNKKGKKMNGICGLCGSALSVNPDRQLCLENKCQQLYATVGGMKLPMIWMEKVTPAGRKLGQLVVSVRPIKEIDCGLWPTPGASNALNRETPADVRKKQGRQVEITHIVAMWPTPTARDHMDSGDLSQSMTRKDGRSRLDCIPRIAFGMETGSDAQTENKGSLNPQFVYWLMGYPKEWVCSVQQGMQLCPKSPRSSSKRSKKV